MRGQYQPLGSLDYSRQWQAALATSQTQIAQLEAALDASQAQVTRLQRLMQENNAFHARIIGEKDQTIARLQSELANRRPSPPPSSLARARPSSPDRRQPHEYRLWAHKALQRMLANPRIDFRESLRELLLCCKYKMMWDPRLKTQLDGVIEGLVASGTLNQSESCGIQTQPTPMGSYGQLIEKLRSKMEAGQERKTRERNASHLIHLVEVLCDTAAPRRWKHWPKASPGWLRSLRPGADTDTPAVGKGCRAYICQEGRRHRPDHHQAGPSP